MSRSVSDSAHLGKRPFDIRVSKEMDELDESQQDVIVHRIRRSTKRKGRVTAARARQQYAAPAEVGLCQSPLCSATVLTTVRSE